MYIVILVWQYICLRSETPIQIQSITKQLQIKSCAHSLLCPNKGQLPSIYTTDQSTVYALILPIRTDFCWCEVCCIDTIDLSDTHVHNPTSRWASLHANISWGGISSTDLQGTEKKRGVLLKNSHVSEERQCFLASSLGISLTKSPKMQDWKSPERQVRCAKYMCRGKEPNSQSMSV